LLSSKVGSNSPKSATNLSDKFSFTWFSFTILSTSIATSSVSGFSLIVISKSLSIVFSLLEITFVVGSFFSIGNSNVALVSVVESFAVLLLIIGFSPLFEAVKVFLITSGVNLKRIT